MKRLFYYLSIVILLSSTIIFTRSVFLQANDERISAFNKSINLALKQNYTQAANELLNIYKNYSNDYLINLRLGYLYYLQYKYDESIKYYKKAVELAPQNSIEPLLGLTLPFAAKENWNEVEKIYLNILNIDLNNYTANLRLGQIYFNRKDYSKSEKYLTKVYNYYPSDYEANLYLGWTYFYLNRKSDAKKHFIYTLMVSENDKSAMEGLRLVK